MKLYTISKVKSTGDDGCDIFEDTNHLGKPMEPITEVERDMIM